MRSSAIIPIALAPAANARLEFDLEGNPTGFGPGNFSVPLRARPGNGADTHLGLSCGNVPGVMELLAEMEASGDFPGLILNFEGKPTGRPEDPRSRGDFLRLINDRALTVREEVLQ